MVRWWMVVFVLGCERAEPLQSPPLRRRPPEPMVAKKSPPRADLSALAAELANVRAFALGGVGILGTPSGGERLTLQLAREPDAIAMFERLANDESRAARLYAYWALRTLDPTRAQLVRARLADDQTMVDFLAGCGGEALTTRELAALIDSWPPPRFLDRQRVIDNFDQRWLQVPAASRASVR